MKRTLVYKPAALRELNRIDSSESARVIRALEAFANSGHGDVKALKGPLKGHYRLRVGKWRTFFNFDEPSRIVVTDVDNRGQAY